MARIPDYVKVATTPSGSTRYQVRIEAGKTDGKRQQQKRRFTKLQDAIDAYNAARGDRSRGVQVSPSGVTLRQAADSYLDSLSSRLRSEIAVRERRLALMTPGLGWADRNDISDTSPNAVGQPHAVPRGVDDDPFTIVTALGQVGIPMMPLDGKGRAAKVKEPGWLDGLDLSGY